MLDDLQRCCSHGDRDAVLTVVDISAGNDLQSNVLSVTGQQSDRCAFLPPRSGSAGRSEENRLRCFLGNWTYPVDRGEVSGRVLPDEHLGLISHRVWRRFAAQITG